MTAARNAIVPALALVLAATSWGCSSTSGSNAAVQLPPRQPDQVAGGYGSQPGYGTGPGGAGPYGDTPNSQGAGPNGESGEAGGYGTAPGVYGSGPPRGNSARDAAGFPQQPTTPYPPAAGAPGAQGSQLAQNSGACNAAAARSVIGQLGTVESSETAKAASGAETVRITYPGQPLAQKVEASRLNLETDNQNRIVNVRCG